MAKTPANTSNPDEHTTVHIKYYPDTLIHKGKTKSGNTFRTVSFRFRDAWASFFIDSNDLQESIRRDGKKIPGKFNITLGEADDVRRVSVKQADGSFSSIWMFNNSIREFIRANKMDYLRSIAI